jgi:hypothetical protein
MSSDALSGVPRCQSTTLPLVHRYYRPCRASKGVVSTSAALLARPLLFTQLARAPDAIHQQAVEPLPQKGFRKLKNRRPAFTVPGLYHLYAHAQTAR